MVLRWLTAVSSLYSTRLPHYTNSTFFYILSFCWCNIGVTQDMKDKIGERAMIINNKNSSHQEKASALNNRVLLTSYAVFMTTSASLKFCHEPLRAFLVLSWTLNAFQFWEYKNLIGRFSKSVKIWDVSHLAQAFQEVWCTIMQGRVEIHVQLFKPASVVQRIKVI